ncbi:MAG: hypothetical protein R3B90_15660 [Planctomycetaceae bacterium]
MPTKFSRFAAMRLVDLDFQLGPHVGPKLPADAAREPNWGTGSESTQLANFDDRAGKVDRPRRVTPDLRQCAGWTRLSGDLGRLLSIARGPRRVRRSVRVGWRGGRLDPLPALHAEAMLCGDLGFAV